MEFPNWVQVKEKQFIKCLLDLLFSPVLVEVECLFCIENFDHYSQDGETQFFCICLTVLILLLSKD